MRFTLLELSGNDLLVAYLICGGIGWVLFYYTVKGAVKWGTIEAMQHIPTEEKNTYKPTPDKIPNTAQEKLQQRYDKGEMSFEEYKTEWAKFDK